MLEHSWIVHDMTGRLQGNLNIKILKSSDINDHSFSLWFYRFCDSPTEELDSRTPKGRAKRGRSAAQQPSNDLSNFTETRSSVSPE